MVAKSYGAIEYVGGVPYVYLGAGAFPYCRSNDFAASVSISGVVSKSFRDATPVTMVESSTGMLGSFTLAQCSTPRMEYLWISVPNAWLIWLAVPENSIVT